MQAGRFPYRQKKYSTGGRKEATKIILQIGEVQLSTHMSYETLSRITSWRWEEVPIIGSTPLLQYGGKDAATITFSGTRWEYTDVGDALEQFETLADSREPQPLTGDSGRYYGLWTITELRRDEEIFRPGQISAVKTGWTITLKYYGERPDPFGASGGSVDSAARPFTATTAQASIASALSATMKNLETVAEAASDPDLSELQNAPGFNRLATESARNARTLNIPEPVSENLYDLDPEAEGGFFSSVEGVKGFLDGRRGTQNMIGGVLNGIRRLPGYGTLKNVPALQNVEGALRSTHSALGDVREVEQTVNRVLQVKGYLTKIPFGF